MYLHLLYNGIWRGRGYVSKHTFVKDCKHIHVESCEACKWYFPFHVINILLGSEILVQVTFANLPCWCQFDRVRFPSPHDSALRLLLPVWALKNRLAKDAGMTVCSVHTRTAYLQYNICNVEAGYPCTESPVPIFDCEGPLILVRIFVPKTFLIWFAISVLLGYTRRSIPDLAVCCRGCDTRTDGKLGATSRRSRMYLPAGPPAVFDQVSPDSPFWGGMKQNFEEISRMIMHSALFGLAI